MNESTVAKIERLSAKQAGFNCVNVFWVGKGASFEVDIGAVEFSDPTMLSLQDVSLLFPALLDGRKKVPFIWVVFYELN
jgi:hypothetical protein